MKLKGNLLFLIILPGLFFSCSQEYSFEGHLAKDAKGNCLPVNINGTMKAATAFDSSNYMDVSVDVTMTGNYSITTDTLDGVYFNKASQFPGGGRQTVRLQGHGTPVNTGIYPFTVHYNIYSSCAVPVTINPPGGATGIFSIECVSGSSILPKPVGVYVAGAPLNDSNQLVIFVYVNALGTYALSTNIVNGISFNASGTFTKTGGQFIPLAGSGTPASVGTNTMTVSSPGITGCDFSITVNPAATDNSVLYYMVQVPYTGYDLYSCKTDGTHEKRLTNFSATRIQYLAEHHSFNEDSTKIYFVVGGQGYLFGGDLMVMNTDGSGLAPVPGFANIVVNYPYFFENGKKLLFGIDTSAIILGAHPNQIFSANIDGSNITKLTSCAAGNDLPDGSCTFANINKASTLIIYAGVLPGGASGIFTMNTDGSNKKVLVPGIGAAQHAHFSPDATKIVYSSQVNGSGSTEIFICNADGSNIVQLTNYSNNATLNNVLTYLPVFSRDGKIIYFSSNETGVNQIYKMNVDGTGKFRITNGLVDRFEPLAN